MSGNNKSFFYNLEKSAVITVIGIILLFSASIIVVLFAPSYIDPSWTSPSSSYQVQMYENSDPHLYISSQHSGPELQYVYHLKENYSLLAFHETETVRILAPAHLEKYVTRVDDPILKLTSHLLLLKKPDSSQSNQMREELQKQWESKHSQEEAAFKPDFEVWELYEPNGEEAFALAPAEGLLENWVDTNFIILDDTVKQPFHKDPGVIYVNNPIEYRISRYAFGNETGWRYDPNGERINHLSELKNHELGFRSREELIKLGEHIYAIEGCWYCHTDQTRTLVQDVVLNGSDSYPAPPSSANEYIYQKITFPGTRRIGPDLSRTGVKRPSRDWHKGHFWSPKTASKGSIMPAFQHFFDYDPRGTSKATVGIPNYRFEAIFQYLMTKGTRITPPTQAWWLGKDPIKTKEIIEGQRRLP